MDRISEILPYRASWQDHSAGPVFVSSEGEPDEESTMHAEPRHLMSEADMDKAVAKIAREIHDEIGEKHDVVLMGIRTRGVPLAEWIARKYAELFTVTLPVGILDINLYRDDLSEVGSQPVVKQTELPVPIQGKGVILVDDVLFTGRTIRAALDAVTDFGRPRFVKLAVFIDRGFRELPIHGDFVGKSIKTTLRENVKVMFQQTDGINQVVIKVQK